jgi:FTR1 family protein
MLEALLVTLREGIEAALMVSIIVAFLRREGLERHLPAVVWGIAAALLASVAGAWALYRWAVNEEVFEGLLYLAAAAVVASLVLWMWRHAPQLASGMKGSLGRIVSRGGAVGWAVFFFTFLMVFREGVETVLFLAALSLSTSGLLAMLGAALGLGAAVVFGVLFVRGSVRVDLGRFFKITGIALAIFVVQLLVNAYHELSEAGWLPASERTMAAIGPLVRNEFFFILAVLALPLLLLLVPARHAAPAAAAPDAAQARLERARQRRERRARAWGGALGIGILALLGTGFVYGRQPKALSPAVPVAAAEDGLRLALAPLRDGHLHRFLVDLGGGRKTRIIAVSTGEAEGPAGGTRVAVAFDACEVCGSHGYIETAGQIECLHCESAVYPPSIGKAGGCNPIPLAATVAGDELRVARADLERGATLFD